jgi:hypothetical protein
MEGKGFVHTAIQLTEGGVGQLDGGGVASGSLHDLIPCITWTCIAVGIDGLFMIWFDYHFYGAILSNAISVAGSCSVHEMTSIWILHIVVLHCTCF